MAPYQHASHALQSPAILAVPGDPFFGPARAIAERGGHSLVELGMWDAPHRNTWVNKLNLAIHRAGKPVVLVADKFACLAAIWWAEYEQPSYGHPVIGALLISPPDVDRPGSDERLARFGACPRQALPFPTYLIAGSNESPELKHSYRRLSVEWGARYLDASFAADGTEWRAGHDLLDRLLREHVSSGPRLQRVAQPGEVRV
jgi:predicted alpha/beta hydrolase family esterase